MLNNKQWKVHTPDWMSLLTSSPKVSNVCSIMTNRKYLGNVYSKMYNRKFHTGYWVMGNVYLIMCNVKSIVQNK